MSHRSALIGGAVVVGAGDPASTRTVYAMVLGLAIVGVLFIFLAVWLIRQTRYDLPVLAPLERMGDSDWRKRDEATQRRILDEERPQGAAPLHFEPAPPSFDTDFDLSRSPAKELGDLGPGLTLDPTPAGFASPTLDDVLAEATRAPEDPAPEDPAPDDPSPDDPPPDVASPAEPPTP